MVSSCRDILKQNKTLAILTITWKPIPFAIKDGMEYPVSIINVYQMLWVTKKSVRSVLPDKQASKECLRQGQAPQRKFLLVG